MFFYAGLYFLEIFVVFSLNLPVMLGNNQSSLAPIRQRLASWLHRLFSIQVVQIALIYEWHESTRPSASTMFVE
jgi:hypothetical protein